MEVKNKILAKSEELFLKYGLKSVTMDDLAKQLGVSKKTLYQFVDNKADLIQQIILGHIESEKALMVRLKLESADAIEFHSDRKDASRSDSLSKPLAIGSLILGSCKKRIFSFI